MTTTLAADGSDTRLTVKMRYRDAATRAKAIQQGVTDGIDQVYGWIDDLSLRVWKACPLADLPSTGPSERTCAIPEPGCSTGPRPCLLPDLSCGRASST